MKLCDDLTPLCTAVSTRVVTGLSSQSSQKTLQPPSSKLVKFTGWHVYDAVVRCCMLHARQFSLCQRQLELRRLEETVGRRPLYSYSAASLSPAVESSSYAVDPIHASYSSRDDVEWLVGSWAPMWAETIVPIAAHLKPLTILSGHDSLILYPLPHY